MRGLIGRDAAFFHAGFLPQLAGGIDRIDAGVLPPCGFVAHTVHQTMVDAAERDSEFIAGLAAERAGLHEPQVMRVRGLAAADEARLFGDVAKVLAIAMSPRHHNREHALLVSDGLVTIGTTARAGLMTRDGGFARDTVHEGLIERR